MRSDHKHHYGSDWMSAYTVAALAGVTAVAPLSEGIERGARWLVKLTVRGLRAAAPWLGEINQERRTAQVLRNLSDRMLEDIGVSRYDVQRLARGKIGLEDINACRADTKLRPPRHANRVSRIVAPATGERVSHLDEAA